MLERLVVDAQLISVSVLHDRQAVAADSERELEGALISIHKENMQRQRLFYCYDLRIIFINDLTILRDLLLA